MSERHPSRINARKWQALRDKVIRAQPMCRLQLAGCTGRSQTADHILTVKARPDLAWSLANLQGACHHCNRRRNAKPIEDVIDLRGQAQALAFFE